MDSKSEGQATALDSFGIFAPSVEGTQNLSQMQLFLQQFDDNNQTSIDLTNELWEKVFPMANFTEQPFIAYWGLCNDSVPLKNADNFRRYVQALLQRIKRPVIFILVDTSELHRHNLAKVSPTGTPRLQTTADLGAPTQISVTTDDDFRSKAIEIGQNLLKQLDLENIEKSLPCLFTVLSWKDLSNTTKFRTLFEKEMHSIATKYQTKFGKELRILYRPPSLINAELDIAELARFVGGELESNELFATALSPWLLELQNKDRQTFGEAFNLNRSSKSNKLYIGEEIAHLMILKASNNPIQTIIQPQTLTKRKSTPRARLLNIGELLHFWAGKLLTLYLDDAKIHTHPLIPHHYITAATYNTFYTSKSVQFADTDQAPTSPTRKASIDTPPNGYASPPATRDPNANVTPSSPVLPPLSPLIALLRGQSIGVADTTFLEAALQVFLLNGGAKGLKTSDDQTLATVMLEAVLSQVKARSKKQNTDQDQKACPISSDFIEKESHVVCPEEISSVHDATKPSGTI